MKGLVGDPLSVGGLGPWNHAPPLNPALRRQLKLNDRRNDVHRQIVWWAETSSRPYRPTC